MNIIQTNEKFPTEKEAVKFFESVRWGGDVQCPHCGGVNLNKKFTPDFRRKCYDCNVTVSVTVNTALRSTRILLKAWLFVFSLITDAKKGLSALQLQRNLDISSPTYFSIYHKVRKIMAVDNAGIEELDDIVEMDETFICAKRHRTFNTGQRTLSKKPLIDKPLDNRIRELKEEGFSFKRKRGNPAHLDDDVKRGRGTKKIQVVGIEERDGNVVAEVMRTRTTENLRDMVQRNVDEDKSVLVTDEFRAYNRLDRIIEHIKIDHNKMYSNKGVNKNTIESFWAIIERRIIGQHHHVSPRHLPKYVSEIVIKFNSWKEGDMVETLVSNSM